MKILTLLRAFRIICVYAFLLLGAGYSVFSQALSEPVKIVLENTSPLEIPHDPDRLPIFVFSIAGQLDDRALSDEKVKETLQSLRDRGIAYPVRWKWKSGAESLDAVLRVSSFQSDLDMMIVADASPCLYSFFDGSPDTLHVDDKGELFDDPGFGKPLGCPFAVDHRIPVIRKRVDSFIQAYRSAGLNVDFVYVDWEVDGPIEWNDAWNASKKCRRCRSHIPDINQFTKFQHALRTKRSELQRTCLTEPVLQSFPDALVGNYGVNPHGGLRFWYDYFESVPQHPDIPVVKDQDAVYRYWAHEFDDTGYTVSMPVAYPWYPIFGWYNFQDPDYRWMYNLLKVASNAGENTPNEILSIPFVHWHTTVPPPEPDPSVHQFSRRAYRDFLRHMILRGHDSFFMWCMQKELSTEVSLVHHVYSEMAPWMPGLSDWTPLIFDVPATESSVISALLSPDGQKVMALVSAFGSDIEFPATFKLPVSPVLPGGATITLSKPSQIEIMAVRN